MKNLFLLLTTAIVAPNIGTAQAVLYNCDSGAVVVNNVVLTLEELAIVGGLDKAERPDFGHYVFQQPDGSFVWARTSTMRAVCRRNPSCRPGSASPNGLLVGPALRIGSNGDVELCHEEPEPRPITMTVCAADGTMSTQTFQSDDSAILDSLGIGTPPTQAHQIYQDSDGAAYWSILTANESAVLCAPEAIANDGKWDLTMRDSSSSDCPPQAVAQGEALGQSLMQDPQVSWGEPFHPSAMLPGREFQNPWVGSGTSWSVRAVEQDNQMVKVAVDYDFEVLDPDHIQIDGRLQFLMDPNMARVAGFGGNCRYRVTFDARRISD